MQFNNRAYRNNMHDAQANIYQSAALVYDNNSEQIAPCYRIKADYENRLFSGISAELMAFSEEYFFQGRIKLGISPYKHSYGGISTWFMLEARYLDYYDTSLTLIPLYRGFYKNYLWELGMSDEYLYSTFMIHI